MEYSCLGLLSTVMIDTMTKNSRMGRKDLSALQAIVYHEGSRNLNKGHGRTLLTSLFLPACSACFALLRTTHLGVYLPTVGWVLPPSITFKTTSHGLTYRPI